MRGEGKKKKNRTQKQVSCWAEETIKPHPCRCSGSAGLALTIQLALCTGLILDWGDLADGNQAEPETWPREIKVRGE